DDIAEQSFAELLIINRRAESKLRVQPLLVAFPELHIVFPAGKEKLPLQLGHLDHLGAGFLLHARIFQRNKKRWHKGSLSVAQIVKQIERLFNVRISFAGQSDDERAKRKPVMPVQSFHSLQYNVAPLMPLIGVCLAFHVGIEKTSAPRFEPDNRIR